MRIVDAVWEKRNLGVDTVEIALDEDDDVNVFEEINTLKQPYQVLKIPNGRIDISSAAQKKWVLSD
ncbi:MAG: hypothetical protein LKF32_06905 [Mageeibacillus sp.]|jgi:hypothetical protein|nr:hypothetical protein [Mageeibacillus sp.]MCI1264407.1 hypothetical protein [Saccharofermentans sp.]MCI1769526.1 hypothetical protein [Mageeibacillus sp.]MCI2044386.1 hypothetical protein [Mageeibacillus sp.]